MTEPDYEDQLANRDARLEAVLRLLRDVVAAQDRRADRVDDLVAQLAARIGAVETAGTNAGTLAARLVAVELADYFAEQADYFAEQAAERGAETVARACYRHAAERVRRVFEI